MEFYELQKTEPCVIFTGANQKNLLISDLKHGLEGIFQPIFDFVFNNKHRIDLESVLSKLKGYRKGREFLERRYIDAFKRYFKYNDRKEELEIRAALLDRELLPKEKRCKGIITEPSRALLFDNIQKQRREISIDYSKAFDAAIFWSFFLREGDKNQSDEEADKREQKIGNKLNLVKSSFVYVFGGYLNWIESESAVKNHFRTYTADEIKSVYDIFRQISNILFRRGNDYVSYEIGDLVPANVFSPPYTLVVQ